jgi:hypothetical protein
VVKKLQAVKVKKYPQQTQPWTIWIQSALSQNSSLISILILSVNLHLSILSYPAPWYFPVRMLWLILLQKTWVL